MEQARRLSGDADLPFDALFVRAEQMRRAGRLSDEAALLAVELRVRPSAAGQFMLAEALIVQGKFRSGWRQFEFRKFERAMREERQSHGLPPWVGQPLSGRAVLVQAEQGVGDVVWFARYFPLLKRRGARVVFLPRADMQRMSWCFDGVDRVLQEGEALPPLDFHVSLMSLATRFGTTLPTIPADVPVNSFWSLSLYERLPDGRLFFVDNPINRYAVGNRTPPFKSPVVSCDSVKTTRAAGPATLRAMNAACVKLLQPARCTDSVLRNDVIADLIAALG